MKLLGGLGHSLKVSVVCYRSKVFLIAIVSDRHRSKNHPPEMALTRGQRKNWVDPARVSDH
jgi:hypothetical protein